MDTNRKKEPLGEPEFEIAAVRNLKYENPLEDQTTRLEELLHNDSAEKPQLINIWKWPMAIYSEKQEDNKMDNMKIGRLILHLRKEKGFTQQQVAEKLHISNKTVSKWETGDSLR